MARIALLLSIVSLAWADSGLTGQVKDLHGAPVTGATVRIGMPQMQTEKKTDETGHFAWDGLAPGHYTLTAESSGFQTISREIDLEDGIMQMVALNFSSVAGMRESIVISASSLEPGVDLRNEETFNRTLFTRDDQVFQQLNAGISAGQHEGGGKSLEIRRFGFNMDHGGVNGGLKVLLDGVQQNQGTQGHGQGYLGSLKSLSPELIQDVTIVNGPFSAEYGDFSGLGVVHIRQRESLPQRYTARLQGGNFNTRRGFLAFSPDVQRRDAYGAYEGSYSDGPFVNPSGYRRDNVNANYTKTIRPDEKFGLRLILGRNNFFSSGQLPLDLVNSGALDRFAALDPSQGGRVKLGTLSAYYSKTRANGDVLKLDGFVGRSLFDLYSNFTNYLADSMNGDAIQQHDSRLQQGLNTQWTHAHKLGGATASFVGGGNFHDNQINVGLYSRQNRVPTGITTAANAHVTNGAGYLQETVSLWGGKVIASGGLRYDAFRYGLTDRLDASSSGARSAGRWQGKASLAYTPSLKLPVTFHANYGRGINSVDARAVVYRPDSPRIGATDFFQAGVSSTVGRLALIADAFLIDRSNEQVYIPDDGTFEFSGPSRAYGFEAKGSINLTHHVSLNAGLTKVGNAFYKGDSRVYVTNAPHFVANAALTVSDWNGWSGSLRMRAINHYRLDGEDPSILAAGYTAFDFAVARQFRRGVELNLSLDNLTNRSYYETQNYFESRDSPSAPALSRIHGTPGYPLTVVVGMTFRLGGK